MFKIDKANDSLCRLCREKSETAEHILFCNCPATYELRLLHFEETTVTPNEIKEMHRRDELEVYKQVKNSVNESVKGNELQKDFSKLK